MVSHLGHFAIESNTRLHPQGAAAAAAVLGTAAAAPLQAAAVPACPARSDLALRVDGWYQQNHLHSLQQQQQQHSEYSTVHGRMASIDTSSPFATGAKRPYDNTTTDASSQPDGGCKRSRGFRINDLLNPASAVATDVSALAAAHNMTVPTSLGRTRSADSKHYYQQIAQLQQRLQNQQQQQMPPLLLPRTSTAPADSAADLCAQGLVREALELDKLYDIACVIIESIWPHHSVSQRTQLCSLRCFVAETHRQSRLSLDALELCMFYLLRAKSIIQAKQRAARQHEEQQEQNQQKSAATEAQARQQQQQSLAGVTPPLSPCSPQSASNGKSATAAVTAASSVTVDGGYSTVAMVVPVAGGVSTDRLISPPSSSPFTPGSAQQMGHAITYIGMDRQHLLSNDMITPVDVDNSKAKKQQQQRAIAGSTGTLPISYRTFVAPAKKQQPATTKAAALSAAGADNLGMQPVSPSEKGNEAADDDDGSKRKPNVTKCGRRMFVAALICASKFMFDRTYSNKAWNKITKLPLAQISDMERAFLDMIDYRLYVDRSTYDKFHRLLARSGMRNGRLMVCDPLSSSPSPPMMASATPTPASPTRAATPQAAGSGFATNVASPVASLSAEQQQQLIKAPRMSSIQLAPSVSSTPISPTAVVPNSADLRGAAMNVPVPIYQHQQHAMGLALNTHHVQYHRRSSAGYH
ncbi:PHO85 cyclin-5 [Coemansia sp. RSA 2559]|nr:PHO85 cyclin-5 [Coemansia sp. RSA 2559]KAJ2865756.1 PHO85 cyclin-5 [Coemansia erecta]